MKKEYTISIEKINDEWFWFLRKDETLIDFMSWEEGKKHGAVGAYLLRKHNISFEEVDYSCD